MPLGTFTIHTNLSKSWWLYSLINCNFRVSPTKQWTWLCSLYKTTEDFHWLSSGIFRKPTNMTKFASIINGLTIMLSYFAKLTSISQFSYLPWFSIWCNFHLKICPQFSPVLAKNLKLLKGKMLNGGKFYFAIQRRGGAEIKPS